MILGFRVMKIEYITDGGSGLASDKLLHEYYLSNPNIPNMDRNISISIHIYLYTSHIHNIAQTHEYTDA